MGRHYFLNHPIARFSCSQILSTLQDKDEWLVQDWDRRRCLGVNVPRGADVCFVSTAVRELVDTVSSNVVRLGIADDGSLLSSSTDPALDPSWVPFYPPRTDFPWDVETIDRAYLTEVDRLGKQVDLVRYSPRPGVMSDVVFKYNLTAGNVARMWHEANCIMRMPRHPNIVPFDALVLDVVDNSYRAVGFTTRYIPGGTLQENKTRVFKLKYLQQLIDAVDHLNLRLGINHGDIYPRNIAIDAEDDSLQLFDFNCASKIGWEGDQKNRHVFKFNPLRNDVKLVIFTLYELITRRCLSRHPIPGSQPCEKDLMAKTRWKLHPDVKLDRDVAVYRGMLEEWVKSRAETDIDHFSKASEPLDWPALYVDESVVPGEPTRPGTRGWRREILGENGKDILGWERPLTRSLPLPEGQRLLASGRVVWDESYKHSDDYWRC